MSDPNKVDSFFDGLLKKGEANLKKLEEEKEKYDKEMSKTVDYEETSMVQDSLDAYIWNAKFENDF